MKVILLKDIKKVGRRDEVVDVADGYAQNVLIRQKLAVPATPEHLQRRAKKEGSAAQEKAYAEALLVKNLKELEGKTVTMSARANEAGTLFQTIHAREVSEAVARTFSLHLPESVFEVLSIKKTGTYQIRARAGSTSITFALLVSQ